MKTYVVYQFFQAKIYHVSICVKLMLIPIILKYSWQYYHLNLNYFYLNIELFTKYIYTFLIIIFFHKSLMYAQAR